MGPAWGPSGADRTQVGPMLAPWTLLSGMYSIKYAHALLCFVWLKQCIVLAVLIVTSVFMLCIHPLFWIFPVWEIPTGTLVGGWQLWRRTGNFLLIFLQFCVYDLRFKLWGPTTAWIGFQTLVIQQVQGQCHNFYSVTGVVVKGLSYFNTYEWFSRYQRNSPGKYGLIHLRDHPKMLMWYHSVSYNNITWSLIMIMASYTS